METFDPQYIDVLIWMKEPGVTQGPCVRVEVMNCIELVALTIPDWPNCTIEELAFWVGHRKFNSAVNTKLIEGDTWVARLTAREAGELIEHLLNQTVKRHGDEVPVWGIFCAMGGCQLLCQETWKLRCSGNPAANWRVAIETDLSDPAFPRFRESIMRA